MRPVTYSVQASFFLLIVTAPALAESLQVPPRARILIPAGGQKISGDLWLPAGTGPFPAVILIPGGEPGNEARPKPDVAERFETLGSLAPHLAAKGIVVLLVIPRSSAAFTLEDRANDVLTGVAYLGQRPEIARGNE